MASAEREPLMRVWGLCPQRGPGAEPLVRGSAYNGGLGAVPPAGSRGRAPGQGGEAPLKLNAFWCCHMSEMALNCYVYELFYGH